MLLIHPYPLRRWLSSTQDDTGVRVFFFFFLPEYQHLGNTKLPKPAGFVTSVQATLISSCASSCSKPFSEGAVKCSPVGGFTVAGAEVLLGGRGLWNAWSSVAVGLRRAVELPCSERAPEAQGSEQVSPW